MKTADKWNREHQAWCAFIISINNGGPFFNRCDCLKKEPSRKTVQRQKAVTTIPLFL